MTKQIVKKIRRARRRWTVEQKRALLNEALKPGETMSSVARRHDVPASMMFQWRRATNDAGDEGLKSNERVYSESEVRKLKRRIAELERSLGRKTVDTEILEAAVEYQIEKNYYRPRSCALVQRFTQKGAWTLSDIARALKVSRSHLSKTQHQEPVPRGNYRKGSHADLLLRIRAVTDKRPSYGYRRVTALLNSERGFALVNHKRVYRVMRQANLLLRRGMSKPHRPHEGKVVTLRSNLRWCSDMFEIRCWSGEKVYVAFSLDCCDREAIAFKARAGHLDATDVRDLMAETIESRFGAVECPTPVKWLTDNGGAYTASETRYFGAKHGLLMRTTPAYSPESNGMAESFVKTFKRDYVYLNDVLDAESVLAALPAWFEDYNEVHPHKGLKMRSPREFRRLMNN